MNERSLINGKVYLSCEKIGDNYFECFYCLFRNGSIVRTGSEDFSFERLKSCTKLFNVRIFNGSVSSGLSGRRYTDSTNLYILADKSVTMASLSRYIVENSEIFGFARLERCYSVYAENLFQFSSAWGEFVSRIEEYPEKTLDYTSDSDSDTSDSDSDTSDSDSDTSDSDSEDTSDTTEDTSDTTEDTSDTTEDTSDTVFLGSFDDVQTDISHIPLISFNSRFLPVPRWFYQRSNIYIWSAVLSAFNAVRDMNDRRKRVIVKPVRISPCSCFPAYRFTSGYPYTVFVDGLEVWDCRSYFYNEYLCDFISAPPYDELPF